MSSSLTGKVTRECAFCTPAEVLLDLDSRQQQMAGEAMETSSLTSVLPARTCHLTNAEVNKPVFVLLFIFVKRQIVRFAMKSRRGPHVPLGHNAPKELRQEIEAKLCQVQKIHFEPRLLSLDDDRLKHREQSGKRHACNNTVSYTLVLKLSI
ncbi:hypothetical protein F7725_018460 [Dissostichus mawsoni]|uniref:Uncharacterized protein n=1 Tax=Dissostichus mawsoni TaxID=36200 RepID=A0A7J5XSE7_DISMA|nr:hypothetical protein F7725_018460 [Dissostichus mawsoni]